MRFKIQTLVDITETKASRGTDPLLVKQQQNFNTFYNVIGLRTNATDFEIISEERNIDKEGFGKKYKGIHRVWTANFYVEAEDSTSIELMEQDFDLIPVLQDLTETSKDIKMFSTIDKELKNILFERIDK